MLFNLGHSWENTQVNFCLICNHFPTFHNTYNMAVVYIWNTNSDSWGHASLEVEDVYISWWPTDSKSKYYIRKRKVEDRIKESLPTNYKDERDNYTGRPADHVFHIPSSKIDVDNIKKWWKDKAKSGYHFLLNNCCDIAVEALREGGLPIPIQLIRTPQDLVDECQKL